MISLDQRTFEAAKKIRDWLNNIPYNISNKEYSKQLVRSSGSVAANYIEATEGLSKKDFKYRLKVCRKEAKESILWIRLILIDNDELEKEQKLLIQEFGELIKIFSSIVIKLEK